MSITINYTVFHKMVILDNLLQPCLMKGLNFDAILFKVWRFSEIVIYWSFKDKEFENKYILETIPLDVEFVTLVLCILYETIVYP